MTLAAIPDSRSEAIGVVQRRVAGKKHVLHLLLKQVSFSARLVLEGKMEELRDEYSDLEYGRKRTELPLTGMGKFVNPVLAHHEFGCGYAKLSCCRC